MIFLFILLVLIGDISAKDVPYFIKDIETKTGINAINENFRSLVSDIKKIPVALIDGVAVLRINNLAILRIFSNGIIRPTQIPNCATQTPGLIGEICAQNSATQPLWIATSTANGGFQPVSLAAE